MPRGFLLLLCLMLLILEPASLALVASGRVLALLDHPAAMLVMSGRLIVTALGVSAGLALWGARPSGAALAKLYLVAASVMLPILVLTPYAQIDLRPGLAGPLVTGSLLQNAAWFAYLLRSRQVRERERYQPNT